MDQQQEDIHDNQTDVIAVPALEAEVPKNIRKTINQNEYVTKIEKSNANKPKQTQEEPTQQHNIGINKYKQKCNWCQIIENPGQECTGFGGGDIWVGLCQCGLYAGRREG